MVRAEKNGDLGRRPVVRSLPAIEVVSGFKRCPHGEGNVKKVDSRDLPNLTQAGLACPAYPSSQSLTAVKEPGGKIRECD